MGILAEKPKLPTLKEKFRGLTNAELEEEIKKVKQIKVETKKAKK